MGAPTVPYRILNRGYTISGDVRSGYKASVSYLVDWANAFTFADDIFGLTSATVVGPVTWRLPYRFPVANADMYAQRFTIEPVGQDGLPLAPYGGLAPGEHYEKAIVKVDFETPSYTQEKANDPQGQQQLDPANPITMCEQSVKIAGKMQTHKGGSYVYADGKPVVGDVGIPMSEARLVLSFPRIPYLPWKLIRPYVNKINKYDILNCERGTLLLTGMDTKAVASSEGISQQLQLEFADNGAGTDWNKLPRNGTYALVARKGVAFTDDNRIYEYKDFGEIFRTMEYLATNLMDIADIKVKPGDPIRAEYFMALVEAIRDILDIRGGSGVAVKRAGRRLSITATAPVKEYYGKASGSITAASGDNPGAGNVDIHWHDGISLVSAGELIEVLNPGTAISSGKRVWVQQDSFGAWFVAPLECE